MAPVGARAGARLLEALLGEEPLERTLVAGLAGISGVGAAAVLIFDQDRLIHECWCPENAERSAEMVEAMRRAWKEPPGAPAACVPGLTLVPLVARGRRVGVLCLAHAGRRPTRGVDGLARALACRAAADLEQDRINAIQTRYERWFKTLDEQIRLLDRERQKFAALVHATGAGVFVTDPAGTVRWTNSVMAERPPADGATWMGKSCGDVCRLYHAGNECDDCPVAAVMHEGQVVHREFRATRHGQVRSSYVTALPIKGPDGQVAEAMVMIQDLSDLEILRTSESRYRQLFERSARGILMVDPETHRILLANSSAATLTGYDPESLLQHRLEDLHTETEWQRLVPHYAALTREDLSPRDCRVLTRSGEERLVRVSGAHTDLDGREVLMIDFRDITETRRVEQALHLVEERLRRVIAASPIILFAIDRDGVYTISEGRGLAAMGLAPGEMVGRSVWEVWKDTPQILANIRRALQGEEFTMTFEVRAVTLEVSYSPLRDAGGEIQGVIGVATDVTERHRLEGQLRHAQRMEAIGRLAGGVAHDFNNLLAAILGHSELILGRLETGHPMRRNAEEVQKAAVRGAMLTRQLLAFSRKDSPSLRVLDMNAVVTGMEGMLTRLIGEDIRLESRVAPRPAPVKADRGQLEQVILNLVVNARDAMPPGGGRILLDVEHLMLDGPACPQPGPSSRSGPHVMLAVTDTGTGMDQETLAHVFEPFYTTKARDKGTGLGLATVYGIVEQSGGHITVHSEPGRGSSFKVFLPLADAMDVELGHDPAPKPSRGGRETVLLAEDEDAVRTLAREVLENKGYTVIEAPNGLAAWNAAAAHQGPIDLLVTDVVMPQMGGGELAQRLTAERPGIKVLFMSGYPDDDIVSGVVQQGTVVLQKPFPLGEFARRVREVLDEPARKAA